MALILQLYGRPDQYHYSYTGSNTNRRLLDAFIENQHVASSVNERYRFIMKPFYHKLSNYFKFVGSFATFMRVKDRKAEYVKTFESYVDQMGKLAHPCIMDGMDYPVTYFKAEQLEQICNDINQIWYFWDRKRNYMKDSILQLHA